ncbi:MAG: tRNA (N(6)-L-threonylcarbamoyladenosine(37)-C(2))-methylthiotransferase [archaeon]|nr:tRNA (N(6)-L-threonylcarbamoyladenosine(37)-C(2))-methylthiotransferase [archaeon]MCP8319832.1 tRNA (N(6)-L-threonylcarbamoyladenosine(37)-C(2))-methylthiotransferase [archaeon]
MGRNFFVKTFGCSANKSDTEAMIGLLGDAGYSLSDLKEADYVLINTCGVKQPTEDRVISTLKQISSLNKKLIIAGCLPRINFERIRKTVSNFSAMLDPRSIHLIVEVIKRIEEGQDKLLIFSDEPAIKPSLPKHLLNPVTGIIQIAEGCSMACTYCCTRFARGSTYCYPDYEIVNEAHRSIKKGCKEIWITSQDNSVYNFKGIRLPDLLKNVCKIEGDFFVRVGMMNPFRTRTMLKDLIESYLDEKIYKFLHLPLQSASMRILGFMKRAYSRNDVIEIIDSFLASFPSLTLSTDVIVGFPTEGDEDFEDTIRFIQKIKPDIVNISKFGARPKTEASKFKQLPHDIVNKRCKELVQIVRDISYEKNLNWLDWAGRCLINEKGKKDGSWMGRNFAYKPIVVKSDQNLLGRFVDVEIIEARSNYLLGKLV